MADQLIADEMDETDGPDDGGILTNEIDLTFAPRPIDGVTVRELGDELVLYHQAEEILFVLDRVGAVVWQCFDGESPLGEIAEDIMAVFDVPAEQVHDDLIDLAMKLGAVGLLVGVTTPQRRTEALGTFAVGDEITPFALADMGGDEVDITELRGHQVLLVNWSPTCGFCLRIAPELAELAPQLAERDVELVLLTTGTPEQNQEVFDEHGLHVRTLLEPVNHVEVDLDDDEDSEEHVHEGHEGHAEHDGHEGHADHEGHDAVVASADGDAQAADGDDGLFRDPFPAMGTPVAYLIGADGRVAAPLATGATEVPALARSAAGIEEAVEQQLPADASYLNLDEGGICGPGATGGKAPRVWAATSAYQIGAYRVGVRADSTRTDEILATFLAASRLPEGTRAPGDYAIVLGDGGTTQRGLNLVLQGSSTVVRTRSPRRALMGLAAYLASHVPDETPGLLRVSSLTVIADGAASILPDEVNGWLDELQPRLARHGIRPIDRPFVTIDVARREVIVDEPTLSLDPSVLEGLAEPPPRRSELAMVEPGRYPLRRWLVWQSKEDPPLTKGQLVTRAMVSCLETAGAFEATLQTVDGLREQGVVFPFDFMTIDELVKRLPKAIAGEYHDEPTADDPATEDAAESA